MASKSALKFKSNTCTNPDQSVVQASKTSQVKLMKMNSVDYERAIVNSRSRDLSLEGRRRVSHFRQTHSDSCSLAPGKKLLRFSDGELSTSNGASQASLSPQARNTSCLRSSKHRGNLSPQISNLHKNRSSLDGPSSLSPSQSLDRNEVPTMKSKPGKKLERFHSTDSPNPPPALHSADPIATLHNNDTTTASDARSRRSQFRRAISLFAMSCDKDTDREKRDKTQQKILRPPTRHVYRRGLSGLPIECTSRSLGMVY